MLPHCVLSLPELVLIQQTLVTVAQLFSCWFSTHIEFVVEWTSEAPRIAQRDLCLSGC